MIHFSRSSGKQKSRDSMNTNKFVALYIFNSLIKGSISDIFRLFLGLKDHCYFVVVCPSAFYIVTLIVLFEILSKDILGGGGSISILRRYKFLFIYKYNYSGRSDLKNLISKGRGEGGWPPVNEKKSPPHDSAFYHIILCVCCKYDWTTNVIFQNKGSLSSDKRDTPKLMLICMHMDVTVEASFESHLVKTFVIYI